MSFVILAEELHMLMDFTSTKSAVAFVVFLILVHATDLFMDQVLWKE